MEQYPPFDQDSRGWNSMLLLSHDLYANGQDADKARRVQELLAKIYKAEIIARGNHDGKS